MLKILAVIGWILLVLVVLLLWVIIVPRSVFVEYTNNTSLVVKVRIFLFKIKTREIWSFIFIIFVDYYISINIPIKLI